MFASNTEHRGRDAEAELFDVALVVKSEDACLPFQLCRLSPGEILRENMVTPEIMGDHWLTDRGPPDDDSSSANGSGAYLKSGAIFNCAKVTPSTALSGYPWLASVAAGSVFSMSAGCSQKSVLASGLAGGWSVAGTTRPSVCHCIASKGTPISFAPIPREPADADHDHPRRSVIIDKNVLDRSDFLVVHPYTETPTSLGARHS